MRQKAHAESAEKKHYWKPYRAQRQHNSSNHARCTCGGRIEMYADSLGYCEKCKRDHFVAKMRQGYIVEPLVDHRHDDVVGHAV